MWGFAVRGSWRPNRNFNILTSSLMAVNVVSFSFFWCSTGAQWSTLLGDGFLCCILSATSLIPISSGPKWLLRSDVAFLSLSRQSLSPTLWNWQLNWPSWFLSWLSYIIVQCPLDLWNRMFNRHQVEITVMSFTGHSLPVHQSMSVPWEFF